MPELNLFELPLSYPPDGYGWDERSMSELSTTTAFRTGLDRRDTFLGVGRCIVCGFPSRNALQYCHIIMQSEVDVVSEFAGRTAFKANIKKGGATVAPRIVGDSETQKLGERVQLEIQMDHFLHERQPPRSRGRSAQKILAD